jgi:predicted chitinase
MLKLTKLYKLYELDKLYNSISFMNQIDREKFFSCYPFRPLKQTQVDNLNFLMDRLDGSEKITLLPEYAYVLATIKLETADTFTPVEEAYWIKPESKRIRVLKNLYKGRNSIIHESGKLYTGRGYVQLTHIENYIKMNEFVQKKFPDADIIEEPDKACEPEIAWIILEAGMTKGLFTGKKLSDYITYSKYDFYHARRIINGMDRAGLVQAYAEKYVSILVITDC